MKGQFERKIELFHNLWYLIGMPKLSVNVNKVATLRNARGKGKPSVVETALKVQGFGADGITVHPRPDERHIKWADVRDLKSHIDVELNIEGFPSDSFIDKVIEAKPAQCTLVPDGPNVLTSNAGWRLSGAEGLLRNAIEKLSKAEIRTSLFVDPLSIEMKELIAFRDFGCSRVELYTESYAEAYFQSQTAEDLRVAIAAYEKCAGLASSMGLGVNAGHDLNLQNLGYFIEKIPQLLEVSIGHALVCEALDFGWKHTLELYRSTIDAHMLRRVAPHLEDSSVENESMVEG